MGQRIRMLVADDSSAIQECFRNVVAESGHAVEPIAAATGAECAELLEGVRAPAAHGAILLEDVA